MSCHIWVARIVASSFREDAEVQYSESRAAACLMIILCVANIQHRTNTLHRNTKVNQNNNHTSSVLIYIHTQHTSIGPAPLKTTAVVCHAAAKVMDQSLQHFLGQKGPPMLVTLDNYSYEKFNIIDWMHLLSR